jgi:hypothetical protein
MSLLRDGEGAMAALGVQVVHDPLPRGNHAAIAVTA